MGIDNGSDIVLYGNIVDKVIDNDRGLRVETRVWLIAKEVLRIEYDSSRNRGTLNHTTRKLRWVEVACVRKLHTCQTLLHALILLGRALICKHIERKTHILIYSR